MFPAPTPVAARDSLRDDARVLRGLLGGVALDEHCECAALPASDQIRAAPVRGRNDAPHAPYAGIACGLVEGLVVGSEIINIKEYKANLVRVALRHEPVAL